MSDAVFYLLDALLGAAQGMLLSSRAKSIGDKYGNGTDPRGTLTQTVTSPVGASLINLAAGMALSKSLRENAQNNNNPRRTARYF